MALMIPGGEPVLRLIQSGLQRAGRRGEVRLPGQARDVDLPGGADGKGIASIVAALQSGLIA